MCADGDEDGTVDIEMGSWVSELWFAYFMISLLCSPFEYAMTSLLMLLSVL